MGQKNGKIKADQLQTMLSETKFSKDEIKLWYKVFSKNSTDHTLPLEAFVKIYGEYFPHGDASKFSQRVFQKFDRDSSGTIDFSEFITTLNITSNGTIDQKLCWAFNLYDIDNNGVISKDELTEIVTAIYEMIGSGSKPGSGSEKIVDRIFEEMDTDGDGVLSLNEFIEGGKTQSYLTNILNVDEKPFRRSLLKKD